MTEAKISEDEEGEEEDDETRLPPLPPARRGDERD